MNIGQYRNIYNRETLLRIARFLTGDASTKEKIMDEYGWVHRQTFNLEQSYEHDVSQLQRFACQDVTSFDCADNFTVGKLPG